MCQDGRRMTFVYSEGCPSVKCQVRRQLAMNSLAHWAEILILRTTAQFSSCSASDFIHWNLSQCNWQTFLSKNNQTFRFWEPHSMHTSQWFKFFYLMFKLSQTFLMWMIECLSINHDLQSLQGQKGAVSLAVVWCSLGTVYYHFISAIIVDSLSSIFP